MSSIQHLAQEVSLLTYSLSQGYWISRFSGSGKPYLIIQLLSRSQQHSAPTAAHCSRHQTDYHVSITQSLISSINSTVVDQLTATTSALLSSHPLWESILFQYMLLKILVTSEIEQHWVIVSHHFWLDLIIHLHHMLVVMWICDNWYCC